MLVWTLVAWLALGGALGRRHAPELREEEPARRGTRPAECQFGKQARELGSTWFADLGPPFGVMYCIKCECVSVQKKRRVVAKVQCRNIKNECPEPTCEQPVLLHGRCCKACPGDSNYPDLLQDIPVSIPDEDELSSKHFVSLLTARSTITVRRDDMTAVPGGEGIASARLALRRRHLQWALAATGGPRALLFLDAGARLLMEQPLRVGSGTQAQYQNATGKLCGVWRRVPREYRKMLREGTMYLALVWGDEKSGGMDTAISGQITRYAALSTEMFSALLTPLTPGAAGPRPSWGGTAVVAANAGAAPSVHVGVVFNGLFAAGDVANVAVRLVLEAPEKNSTVFEEVQTLSKPLHEWNIIEVSSPVTAAELRMLARGKLVIRLESPGAPLLTIRGTVGQLATCDLFQAPLAAERHTAELTGAGMAWMYIDAEGSLVYNVQIDGMLVADAPKITLVDEFGRRHTQVEILDTSIGVLARPSARIFSPLYEEQLGIHVGFETGSSLLKGRLLSRPVPDAADNGPVLMKRASLDQPAGLVGIAWISVDHLCSLHYDLTLSGSAIDTISSGADLYLETWPLLAPGAVPQYRHLNSISSSYTDGYLLEPSAVELTRLQNGVVFLELRGPNNGTTILKAQLKQINVPQNCLPQYSDNEVSSAQTSLPSHSNTPTDLVVSSGSTCFHSGSFYDDGAQWRSKVEACTMCGCVHGSVRCDPVRCPNVSCQGNSVTRPGECCPICTNSTAQEWNTSSASMQGCYLAGQFHAAGSSWHPYLVPGGYDTCAVCACEVRTLVVRCPRVKCPSLQCSDKVAFRPDKKSCCRTCPEIKETVDKKSEDGVLRDEPKPRTPEEILADGGCVFTEGPLPNGKEVHPNIHSHGEQKCVTCRCKDGILTCTRKRCARAACARRRPGEKRAAPDMCCVQQCRRPRRHPRRHRPPT